MKKFFLICFIIVAAAEIASAQAPSISTIVNAIQKVTNANPQPVLDMLGAAGYEYRFSTEESGIKKYVYSKNCKVLHEEYRNGLEYLPANGSSSSSIVIISAQGIRLKRINIQIYSDAGFKTWVSQLRALGYKSTPNGGMGNQGRDWEYAAPGKPTISIWNDFSNTYVLTIGR